MLLLSLLLACGTPAVSPPSWQTFGAPVASTDVVSLAAVLDTPEAYEGREVVLEGQVADVCQKAGCWMVVADGPRTLRVLMKDHAFAVPKDAAGKVARVAGTIRSKAVEPATVAHYASEAAKPELVPEQDATRTWQIVASAVQLPEA